MKVLLFAGFLCAMLLAACATATPTPAPVSATIGTRVRTDGGSYTNITAQELNTMLAHKDFALVNTHIPYAGELAQTDAFVPFNALDEDLGKLPADKNAKIVLYCRSGNMSTIASNALVKKGYTNLYNLVGGMDGWEQAGYPLLHKQ